MSGDVKPHTPSPASLTPDPTSSLLLPILTVGSWVPSPQIQAVISILGCPGPTGRSYTGGPLAVHTLAQTQPQAPLELATPCGHSGGLGEALRPRVSCRLDILVVSALGLIKRSWAFGTSACTVSPQEPPELSLPLGGTQSRASLSALASPSPCLALPTSSGRGSSPRDPEGLALAPRPLPLRTLGASPLSLWGQAPSPGTLRGWLWPRPLSLWGLWVVIAFSVLSSSTLVSPVTTSPVPISDSEHR